MRRLLAVAVLVALVAAATLPAWAQRNRRGFGWDWGTPATHPYNGRFMLARLWYADYGGWAFDWPDMEYNLGQIVEAVTAIRPHPEAGGNVFRMDDPELLKFPIAYLSEPGSWYPSDSEALGLRTFLAKGGFLIVDDFHYDNEWAVFERAMRRVLPDAHIERLELGHPVFNAFFHIQSLQIPYPGTSNLFGEFYGIHEDNDPTKRLSVVINYNMDIGDYMEWSATGRYVVSPTNDAYKFAINYLVYGMTH
jgi:hypothetical protein